MWCTAAAAADMIMCKADSPEQSLQLPGLGFPTVTVAKAENLRTLADGLHLAAGPGSQRCICG